LCLELEKKGFEDMSEESSFWINLAEKLLGLLVVGIGALMLYFTATSTGNLNVFTGFFVFVSVVLVVVGLFLLIVRPSE
jgi:hypothetical protein